MKKINEGVIAIVGIILVWCAAIFGANLYLPPAVAQNPPAPVIAPSGQGWAPTDASGAGLIFASVSANYQRSGNLVFLYGSITYPATADGSSAAVGGLPVTVGTPAYAKQCSVTISTVAALIYLIPTGNSMFFAGVSGANITNAQMSGGTFRFMCIYPTS